MSAIEAGIYRKPAPDCPKCKGKGRTVEVAGSDRFWVRCPCTDARAARLGGDTMGARVARVAVSEND